MFYCNRPGGGVGAGGCWFWLLPNVVNAVELTPNNIMKTVKSIVKLPHCVNLLSGSIFERAYFWIPQFEDCFW